MFFISNDAVGRPKNDYELHFHFDILPFSRRNSPVIVCHCHSVSERAIRKAVRNGAVTRRDIARTCGAGRTCRGCVPAIQAILRSQENSRVAEPLSITAELATS
jgi:bacterioferritin-associated ferredoxin